jgi:hypothetical protein
VASARSASPTSPSTGRDSGIRIKSNASRGGLVHDVAYDVVCTRNSPNPIFIDSAYTAAGSLQATPPTSRDITLPPHPRLRRRQGQLQRLRRHPRQRPPHRRRRLCLLAPAHPDITPGSRSTDTENSSPSLKDRPIENRI